MTIPTSPGARFRSAMREEKPLQLVGAINASAARLAERSGFKALYVSGGGVAEGATIRSAETAVLSTEVRKS